MIVSQQELAGFFRVTARTVRDWTAEGLPRRKDGRYNLRAAIAWYVERRAKQTELEVAQTRLFKVRADALAAQNAQRRRELGEPAIWREEVEKFLREIRAAVGALPARLAPLLTGGVNERKRVLEDGVREVLSRFATRAV